MSIRKNNFHKFFFVENILIIHLFPIYLYLVLCKDICGNCIDFIISQRFWMCIWHSISYISKECSSYWPVCTYCSFRCIHAPICSLVFKCFYYTVLIFILVSSSELRVTTSTTTKITMTYCTLSFKKFITIFNRSFAFWQPSTIWSCIYIPCFNFIGCWCSTEAHTFSTLRIISVCCISTFISWVYNPTINGSAFRYMCTLCNILYCGNSNCRTQCQC